MSANKRFNAWYERHTRYFHGCRIKSKFSSLMAQYGSTIESIARKLNILPKLKGAPIKDKFLFLINHEWIRHCAKLYNISFTNEEISVIKKVKAKESQLKPKLMGAATNIAAISIISFACGSYNGDIADSVQLEPKNLRNVQIEDITIDVELHNVQYKSGKIEHRVVEFHGDQFQKLKAFLGYPPVMHIFTFDLSEFKLDLVDKKNNPWVDLLRDDFVLVCNAAFVDNDNQNMGYFVTKGGDATIQSTINFDGEGIFVEMYDRSTMILPVREFRNRFRRVAKIEEDKFNGNYGFFDAKSGGNYIRIERNYQYPQLSREEVVYWNSAPDIMKVYIALHGKYYYDKSKKAAAKTSEPRTVIIRHDDARLSLLISDEISLSLMNKIIDAIFPNSQILTLDSGTSSQYLFVRPDKSKLQKIGNPIQSFLIVTQRK